MKPNHLAIIKALTILRNEIEKGQVVNIYTDSSYSMRCCTSYGEKMSKKGWKNKGKDIPNVEIVKVASKYCENAKIAVRNIRRDHIENIRKLQKNSEISEDQKHQDEALVQEITDEMITNIDNILFNKEKEILEN